MSDSRRSQAVPRFKGFHTFQRAGFSMRFLTLSLLAAVATATLYGQQPAAPGAAPDPAIKTLVGRLDLEKYKATVKGLTQFGDRRQGTERNRKAVDWIEAQLKSYGCPTERIEVRVQPAAADDGRRRAAARAAGRSRRIRSLRAAKCDPGRAARAIAAPRGGPASTTIPTRSPTRSCASSIASRPHRARASRSTAPRSAPPGPTRCTSSARTWTDTAGARPRTTTARARRW